MELGIDSSVQGDHVVLVLAGDVDIHTAPQVRDRLAALQAEGAKSVVVDLSGVGFLDSSALGALVAAHRELEAEGGSLKLAAPEPAERGCAGSFSTTSARSVCKSAA